MKHKKGVKVERVRKWKEVVEIFLAQDDARYDLLACNMRWLQKHASVKKTRNGHEFIGSAWRGDEGTYWYIYKLLRDPTDDDFCRNILLLNKKPK